MRLGLIGSGNMARALALGFGEPVLCTDAGSGRAVALAQLVGGEAVGSNYELAQRCDIVILAHKPAQLGAVATEIAGVAKGVVSVLARTSVEDLRAAYPGVPVVRVEPNLAVEYHRGVAVMATPSAGDAEFAEIVRELFEKAATVVEVPDQLVGVAAACSGVGPAYWALMVEAQVDAAVRAGLPSEKASILVVETMAGSAELLRHSGYDTLGLRRRVASPGGTTARGLAALERGGVRAAFNAAMEAVVEAE